MKKYDVSTNWELEIEQANHGRFSIDSLHNIVLSYSQENMDCFHTQSRIVKINDGEVTELYENKFYLGTPIVDRNGFIYVCTSDSVKDGKEERSRLLKIGPEGNEIWEYLLDAPVNATPAIYHDSVLVFDFSAKEQNGHLHRIDGNGALIWKRVFNGNAFVAPQLFKINLEDSILVHAFDDIFILDMDGKTFQNKRIGRPYHGLWVNEDGRIYASLSPPNLLCLNTNLDIVWRYKPGIGFANVPRTDSQGNLYSMLTDRRMVSLDSHGKERWIAGVTGDFGLYPIILSNGDILMVTEQKSGKKAPQIEDNTYLEIFSSDGIKVLEYEFSGGSAYPILDTDGTIFLYTQCRRVYQRKQQVLNSIKMYSIYIGKESSTNIKRIVKNKPV